MKKFQKSYYLILLWGIVIFFNSSGQTCSIMSYNIRYDNTYDIENNWKFRKGPMVELLNHYHPTILGTQEGLFHQLSFLDSSLMNYKYIGIGREDGIMQGEYCAIFYDTTIYSIIFHSTFWLSDKCDTISVGWDAALERICTYGLFEHKLSKNELLVFNTHFDHLGTKSREKSAELILNKIEEINENKLPVILMGDLNSTLESIPIQNIKTIFIDAMTISKQSPSGPAGTFNGFHPNDSITKRIDYIFVKKLEVLSYVHLDDRRKDNSHISDHIAVMAEIEFIGF